MKNKKKKGFSLVEVAIALAIITIVTVTALTIALNSIVPKINNNNRSHAQNFAYNAWQCFQEAENADEVFSFLGLSYDLTDMRISQEPDENGYTTYTYTSKEHNYTASIKLLYPQGDRPQMKISIVDDKKDKEIITFSYERGMAYEAETTP